MFFDENEIEIRRENRVITTERLISLRTLLARWTGATDIDILETEATGELRPYYCEKSIITQDGRNEKWLQPSSIPSWHDFERTFISDDEESLTKTVFIESNIIAVEKEHPDFLCMRTDINNEQHTIEEDQQDGTYTASHLLQRIEVLEKERDSLAAQIAAQGKRQKESTEWRGRYPILAEVVSMVARGAAENEVGKYLKGKGVSQATIGALLRDNERPVSNGGHIKTAQRIISGETRTKD